MNIVRGKRVDTCDWAIGYYVYDKHDMVLENLNMRVGGIAELTNSYVVSRDTVSKYTGYHDKNGNMMFENDIICWVGDIKYIIRYGYFAGRVGLGYYYGLGFYFERVGDPEHRVPFNVAFVNEYEVLGNIFDDKELLKVEK